MVDKVTAKIKQWVEEAPPIKVVQRVGAWAFVVVIVSGIIYTLYTVFQPHSWQAVSFINAVLWSMILYMAALFCAMYLLDWITPKTTLLTLLALTKDSPPHQWYCVTAFYIGFMWAVAMVLRANPFGGIIR